MSTNEHMALLEELKKRLKQRLLKKLNTPDPETEKVLLELDKLRLEVITDRKKAEEKRKAERENPRPTESQPEIQDDLISRIFRAKRDRAYNMILDAQAGNRHDARMRASYLMGGLVGIGYISEQSAYDYLSDALQRSESDCSNQAYADIKSGLRNGQTRPIDIKAEIAAYSKPGVSPGNINDLTDVPHDIADDGNYWKEPEISLKKYVTSSPPPFEFIVPGFMAKGLVGFVYGTGGSAKSLAMLWLGMQRAVAGIDGSVRWLNHFHLGHKPGRTLFLSAEEEDLDIWHRVNDISQHIFKNRVDVSNDSYRKAISDNFFIAPKQAWEGVDKDRYLFEGELENMMKIEKVINTAKRNSIDLIIIETYNRVINANEIDNTIASKVVSALERIRDETKATVLCIAHVSKSALSGHIQGTGALRGASANMDNARFGLYFKLGDKEAGGSRIEVDHTKAYRCKKADMFEVLMNYPTLVKVDSVPREDQIRFLALDWIIKYPGVYTKAIAKAIKKRREDVADVLDELKDEGFIYREPGKPERGRWYPTEKGKKDIGNWDDSEIEDTCSYGL